MSSNLLRNKQLADTKNKTFDIAIIGGGITGAGIALDAASRGLNVVLFEKNDFASGTSSKCTKLIHGGLRYLKQGNLALVSKTAKERELVYKNAPHLLQKLKLIIPIYKGGSLNRFTGFCALTLYDYLAQVSKQDKKKIISREEMLRRFPHIRKDGLIAGIEYVEYQTNDALLTFSVIKTATTFHAKCFNYTEVKQFIYENDKLSGLLVKDKVNNEEFKIFSKVIINATGPWVEQISALDQSKESKIVHSKGCHIVIDEKKLPLSQSVYFDTTDGRMVFIIKKEKMVYIGTTDTLYTNSIENITVTAEDRQYLLSKVKELFPSIEIGENDIEAQWAGVRPLVKQNKNNMSEISRKDEIWLSKSGLVTIAGGKLTGYRQMADDILTFISKKFHLPIGPCQTKEIEISSLPLIIQDDLSNLETVVRFLKHEGCIVTLEDVYLRRLDDYYFHRKKFLQYYEQIFDQLKENFHWTDEDLKEFKVKYLSKNSYL